MLQGPWRDCAPANDRALTSADCLGTRDNKDENPIVGSWFRIERGPPATPPKYEYDEVGIVIEGAVDEAWYRDWTWPLTYASGTITLEDEDEGTEKTVTAGDTFVIHRGSTIAFSTSDYGAAFKCGARLMARL